MQTIKAYIYHVSNPQFAVIATSNLSDVDAVNKALENIEDMDYKTMQSIRVRVTNVYTNAEDVVYVMPLLNYMEDTK